MKTTVKLGLSLLMVFLVAQGFAKNVISESALKRDPQGICLNGKRVVPIIDQRKEVRRHSSSQEGERCGSSYRYRKSRRCGDGRPYYRKGHHERRHYKSYYAGRHGRLEDSGALWHSRLEGYWDSEGGWTRYEIIVSRHSVKVRRLGWFGWYKKLYPVEIRAHYGYFENDNGDYLEWDDGILLWHRAGKRIIPLYPSRTHASCY